MSDYSDNEEEGEDFFFDEKEEEDEEDEPSDDDEVVTRDSERDKVKELRELVGKERKGRGIITRIQIASLLNVRSKHLSESEPTLLTKEELVELEEKMKKKRRTVETIDVAMEEFLTKKDFPLQLYIEHESDGCYEVWKIREMTNFPLDLIPNWYSKKY